MSADNVENLADSLAKTSIADNDAQKANGTGNEEAVAASAAEGRRLYVGNLAYATTEEELKAFFQDYAIESVSIPNNPRTGRPVGYAFVDLTNQADAEKAISELSGKEVLQRKVSVQPARKYTAGDEKGDGAANGGENVSGGEGPRRRYSGRGRGRGRGRFRGRGGFRGSRSGQDGQAQTTESPTNVPGQVDPLTDHANNETADHNDADGTTGQSGRRGRPRGGFQQRRQRGPPEDGIVSKVKVMVANLPYDYTEEKLRQLFAEYEPTMAKIALRPIPRFMIRKLEARKETRKGRGFGFVTLASEEMQQKAINEMNGKDVEGREIAVKVAIDTPGKEDHVEGAHGGEGNEQANDGAEEQAAAA